MDILIISVVLILLVVILRVASQSIFDKWNSSQPIIEPQNQNVNSTPNIAVQTSNVSNNNAKTNSSDDEDELAAVMAATAYIMINKRYRIRNIRFIQNSDTSSWAIVGRQSVMSSHNVK